MDVARVEPVDRTRAGQDVAPNPPLPGHVGHPGPPEVVDRIRHHGVEVARGVVGERGQVAHPGDALEDLRAHRPDVALHQGQPAPVLLEQLVEVGGAEEAPVQDRDLVPFPQQPLHQRPADVAGASGDQHVIVVVHSFLRTESSQDRQCSQIGSAR